MFSSMDSADLITSLLAWYAGLSSQLFFTCSCGKKTQARPATKKAMRETLGMRPLPCYKWDTEIVSSTCKSERDCHILMQWTDTVGIKWNTHPRHIVNMNRTSHNTGYRSGHKRT